MLPEYRFIELNFENLIVDPENQLKNITKFLGLEFEQSMIRDYMMNADIKVGKRINEHHVHLKEKPSPAQALKWKKYLKPVDQAIAYEIAGSLLVDLGYDEGITRHRFKFIREVVHRLYESYNYRFKAK